MSIDRGYFIQPKVYCLVNHKGEIYKRVKGFERSFIEKLKEEDFRKALNGDFSSMSFKKEVLGCVFESLRRNGKFLSMVERSKSIKTPYDKRIILEEHLTVPKRVEMW